MVDLIRTPEQDMLADATRRFFAAKGGAHAARELLDTPHGYDSALWTQLAAELGLQGMVVPEELGGGGFGVADLAVVCEEMGRVLFSGPFLATSVLAVQALRASGHEPTVRELLPRIASGDAIATLAPGGAAPRGWARGTRVEASRTDDSWQLSGTTHFVLDACAAHVLLVYAEAGSDPGLFLVQGDAEGVTRTALPTLDPTRRQARVTFDAAPATELALGDGAQSAVRSALRLGTVALAAEQVGGAQRCLELAVDYAKSRIQFGKPIGTFQAIKHKCADLLLEIESARSAARYAASVADSGDESARLEAAALAGAYCSDMFFRVAAETVQIHGGIGFTWEHDAQLYFRRAKADQVLFGTPRDHRAVLAARLGLVSYS